MFVLIFLIRRFWLIGSWYWRVPTFLLIQFQEDYPELFGSQFE